MEELLELWQRLTVEVDLVDALGPLIGQQEVHALSVLRVVLDDELVVCYDTLKVSR